MTENKYFEYRKWSPFWGVFLDSKKEVQKVLSHYNADGWKVVQFEWGAGKLPLTQMALIILLHLATLGFMTFWVGFAVVLEREIPQG